MRKIWKKFKTSKDFFQDLKSIYLIWVWSTPRIKYSDFREIHLIKLIETFAIFSRFLSPWKMKLQILCYSIWHGLLLPLLVTAAIWKLTINYLISQWVRPPPDDSRYRRWLMIIGWFLLSTSAHFWWSFFSPFNSIGMQRLWRTRLQLTSNKPPR